MMSSASMTSAISSMRCRFRTQLIALACMAACFGVVGWVVRLSQPVPITKTAKGNQAIEQLSGAALIEIELHGPPGGIQRFDLPEEGRKKLGLWLSKGHEDKDRPERIMVGRMILEGSKDSWLLLNVNDEELSVQTPLGVWRGLDRAEFERIISARLPKE